MSPRAPQKIRSGHIWEEVRRAWEAGETAASVARRYDVGLDNLWRRRAKEGWQRRPADAPPEPVEGWDRYAARKVEEFEAEREAVRELALDLVRVMQGGPIEEAPLWHMSFVYDWRARHLGPEVAAMDRERAQDHEWAQAFWDAEGRLRPLPQLDAALMRLFRQDWRRQVELPDGVAEAWP